MCGRFALFDTPKEIANMFHVGEFIEFSPSYNIAPSHQVPVFLNNMGERQSTLLTWGLIPSWAKDNKNYQINARIETVAEKPFFRSAFKSRRCLVPVSCWFEWRTENNTKQPYCFRSNSKKPLVIAGLWEHWTSGEQTIYSFALLIREADTNCSRIHNRMPVLISNEFYDQWLSADVISNSLLELLIKPEPICELDIYPVSKIVNTPKNNNPCCIDRIAFDE